jgi:hypothetical protein
MRTSLRYHRDTVTDFTEIYPISMEESNLQGGLAPPDRCSPSRRVKPRDDRADFP